MPLSTYASIVFAIGSAALAISMLRVFRTRQPETRAGRRRAARMAMPGAIVWVVCAAIAAVLIVLGDPGMLVFVATVSVVVAVLLGVAIVVGRNLDRDLDARDPS